MPALVNRADSLAHRQSEWSYSWHTTNQRIQWLSSRTTASLLRLRMLIWSVVPKASNTAEHTEQICSRPLLGLSKQFRRPMVGPVCSCLYGLAAVEMLASDPWSSSPLSSRLCLAQIGWCGCVPDTTLSNFNIIWDTKEITFSKSCCLMYLPKTAHISG